MREYYADSSVLVKLHIQELGTDWFTALTIQDIIITSRISMVEVYSAFNRRLRENHLTLADYVELVTDFEALAETEYELIELTPAIVEQAKQLLERYPLRAYDAVQLATALQVNLSLQPLAVAPLIFLSADNRLLTAAQAEGLATDNPNLHS